MAISHSQPLLLPLLLSLLFLPAALGASHPFFKCNSTHEYRANVKTLDVTPYPIRRGVKSDITISGDTAIIPDGATVELSVESPFFTPGTRPASFNKTYSFCDIAKCPVGPGSFMYTLSNVFTKRNRNISDGATVTFGIWGYISEDRNYSCMHGYPNV